MTGLSLTPSPLASRGMKPVAELAASRSHGDRLRYIAGCRCFHCRRANSDYERKRQAARKAGDWNGLVCARKARAYLAELSSNGIGRRAVGAASDVSDSVLSAIIAGSKTTIRARTERAILAVTTAAAADRALIPAWATWQRLDELLADGYTKTYLAQQLGYSRALQLSRTKVTVRNAHDVERLYWRLRFTDASLTSRLLTELANEGYPRREIISRFQAMAQASGIPEASLVVRRNRIQAHAETLVKCLRQELTA